MTIRQTASGKIIRSLALFLALALCILIGSCKNREGYRKELEQRGMIYSAESFLNEVEADNRERVELFLKAGMDVNVRDKDGHTAIMLASIKGDPETINLLMGKGADINARSAAGYTALLYVSSKGDTATGKLLIKKGADVNARNNDGDTPLMLAALNGNLEMVKLLIEKDADVNARNEHGDTALKYAFLDRQLEELLRKAGAKQ